MDKNNEPLMPCHPARARELLRKKRAIYFWRAGIFCIRLLDRVGGEKQPVALGIDPGSKREGFTVKSRHHTYLNVQSKAVDWLSPDKHPVTKKRMFKKALSKIEIRAELRRTRRSRNAPYRKERGDNRLKNKKRIPPSTHARWQAKLRVVDIAHKLFPLDYVVVEDIKAESKKGQRRWNVSFNPLQVGKTWFYEQIDKLGLPCYKIPGWMTAQARKDLGFKKSSNKLASKFNSHCIDSWTLANMFVGGHIAPDNTEMLLLNPLPTNRRKLHEILPAKKGVRRSRNKKAIFEKNALIWFANKIYLCGGVGSSKNSISLNDMDGKRVKRSVTTKKTKLIYNYNKWGYGYA